jgi:hypothetical protein
MFLVKLGGSTTTTSVASIFWFLVPMCDKMFEKVGEAIWLTQLSQQPLNCAFATIPLIQNFVLFLGRAELVVRRLVSEGFCWVAELFREVRLCLLERNESKFGGIFIGSCCCENSDGNAKFTVKTSLFASLSVPTPSEEKLHKIPLFATNGLY